MREQLLDAYNIEYGVLEPLLAGNTSRNLDEAAALCSAINDWQVARLRGAGAAAARLDPGAAARIPKRR